MQIGLGVFVAQAGDNLLMLHQAANDGFRGIYLHCFQGPDYGKGFLILANSDNPAVLFQCELARLLLGPSGTLSMSQLELLLCLMVVANESYTFYVV